MTSSAPDPRFADEVIIRRAFPDDATALTRLAALDSRRPLAGPVLVAERDGRVQAALALEGGAAVADPFSPTADLVTLLRVRAAALQAPAAARAVTSFRRRLALARG